MADGLQKFWKNHSSCGEGSGLLRDHIRRPSGVLTRVLFGTNMFHAIEFTGISPILHILLEAY